MNKFLSVLILATTTVGLITGCFFSSSTSYQDKQGRFSYEVHDSLKKENIQNSELYEAQLYSLDNKKMWVAVIAVKVNDENAGLSAGFQVIGRNFDEYSFAAATGMGDWNLRVLASEDNNDVAVAYQIRQSVLYGMFVYSDDASVDVSSPPSPIMKIVRSFSFTPKAGKAFQLKTQNQIESHIQEVAQKNGGSISVAVMHENSIRYQYAYGLRTSEETADTSTAYNWGSITKIMTAISIMHLVENDRLLLDEKIQTYIPELSVSTPITARQLLTHSSGLPDKPVTHLIGWKEYAVPDFEETFKHYNSNLEELDFLPGSISIYNNWNFLMLAIVFERITKESMLEYVKENIFEPYNMQSTAYFYKDLRGLEAQAVLFESTKEAYLKDLVDNGIDLDQFISDEKQGFIHLDHFDILPAWGGIRSTAGDALTIASIFLNQGEIQGKRLLKKDTVQEMTRMQIRSTGEIAAFGLGWMLGSDSIADYVQHTGGGPGINSLLRFYPNKDVAVVVFGNFNNYNPSIIAEALVELTLEKNIRN